MNLSRRQFLSVAAAGGGAWWGGPDLFAQPRETTGTARGSLLHDAATRRQFLGAMARRADSRSLLASEADG